MAHRHMQGYAESGRCHLAAVADLDRGNAEAFIEEYNPKAGVYEDYREMMARERPDIVSVCLWPHLHAKVVCDIAPFRPKAIHCEKPMDIHWDASLRMRDAAREHDVQLTLNHQRRFNKPFLKLKALLAENAIGELQRMEAAWGNLFDAGTHWFDMLFYLNDDTPADWVLGQVEPAGGRRIFGALVEGHAVVTFRFSNGVRASMWAGQDHADLGCMIRVFGTGGIAEVASNSTGVRLLRFASGGWEDLDTGESIHDDAAIYRGIADLLDSLETGRTPLLSVDHAIKATEIIFATYASSAQRGRIDLPLAPGPSALLTRA
jgi:predicted dehydrogenase